MRESCDTILRKWSGNGCTSNVIKELTESMFKATKATTPRISIDREKFQLPVVRSVCLDEMRNQLTILESSHAPANEVKQMKDRIAMRESELRNLYFQEEIQRLSFTNNLGPLFRLCKSLAGT